ncbi:MAG: EAL domain-containing protein [Desulfuromonadaceae bacterium]
MDRYFEQILEQERSSYAEQLSAITELLERTQMELLDQKQHNSILESEINSLSEGNIFGEYREYFDNIPVGVIVLNRHGIIDDLNLVSAKFFQINRKSGEPISFRSLLSTTGFGDFSKLFSSFKINKNQHTVDFHLLQLKDRRQFSLHLSKTHFYGKSRALMLGVIIPVETANSAHSEYLANLAVDQLREGIVITDEDGKILRVNNAFSEITGYSRDESIGENPRILKSGRHGEDFYKELWEQISHHGWWQGEIWNKRKNGHIYPQWLQISRIFEPATQKVYYISTISDISERKEHQSELDRLAHYDTLTGLMNRHFVKISLQNLVYRAVEDKSCLMAVMFVDLDHFKLINDQYGHHEGDLVLQEAANRILASVRQTDVVGRVGGDEFVVILTRLEDAEDAAMIAEKIIHSVSQPYKINKNSHLLSASIGVAFYPDDGIEINDLMRRADAAMYRSKKKGRAQVVFFTMQDEKEIFSHDQLKTLIRSAIKTPELHIDPHYQPILDCQTGELSSLEALLRIQDETGNWFSPADVIEVAENENLIVELGEKIFERICAFVSNAEKNGSLVPAITVNLSVHQLNKDDLFGRFNKIAGNFELELSRFNFEVTETSAMQNIKTILHTIYKFKEAGCKVLLDDFGTGFASLSQLHMLPVDIVKIDRTFTAMIDNSDESHRDFIRAIASMVKILKIDIIIEGVETQSQLEWLKGQNVDLVQGYYFSKPVKGRTLIEEYC